MATVKEAREQLRSELEGWIEIRLGLFHDMLEAEAPMSVPVVSDFRLCLCLEDAADNDANLFYPTVGSDTALHRHIGLLEWTKAYLMDRDA